MSYGKVHETFWTDQKVLSLSDTGKLLALYFLSGPHRNAIGCCRVPAQYICADLGWGMQGVSKALQELVGIGFITRDESTGWTLVNNLMKYDPIRGDKAAIGAYRLARAVPTDSEVYQALYERLQPILDAEIKADGYSLEPPSKGDVKDLPSPKPFPNPSLTQPSPADARAREAEFEEWWEVYPKKVAKGQARKAFMAAIKKTDLATLKAKAQAIDRSCDDRFIPHPATWLNGERWLDDPGGAGGEGQGKRDPDVQLRAYANVIKKGQNMPFVPDQDIKRMIAKGWLSAEEARSAGRYV